MKRLILGTAGHVDHGKTSLVRALTGVDCDTHPEETRRGITINPGFTHLQMTDGHMLSLVDVPGHHQFIHNMVAGSAGIDAVMLVVAADDGVMPQTNEHLQILEFLGVRTGVVVLSKIDLVDAELQAMACDELREALRPFSFLADTPIISVSSQTGAGLDELRMALTELASRTPERSSKGCFRLFIDRAFSVQGHGTVVTGTALGGRLQSTDMLYLLPSDRERLRIRRIERHGSSTDQVSAGDRVSLNLPGLKPDDIGPGMVLSTDRQPATRLFDARLTPGPDTSFTTWSEALLHLGTFNAQVRIHVIDTQDASMLAQIHVPRDLVAHVGDRFILRSTCRRRTLAGGTVLDSQPLHHRRPKTRTIAELQRLASGDRTEALAVQVRKQAGPLPASELARSLGCEIDELQDIPLPTSIVRTDAGEVIYLLRERWEQLLQGTERQIRKFHKRHPLSPTGWTVAELIGLLKLHGTPWATALVTCLVHHLADAGQLRCEQDTWVLADHRVLLDQTTKADLDWIEQQLGRRRLEVIKVADLMHHADKRGWSKQRGQELLFHLERVGRLVHHDGQLMLTTAVEEARERLRRHLAGHADGMTVAGFRDLMQSNRRVCLFLLAVFDREGFTRRDGDYRHLGENGRTDSSETMDLPA